MEKGAFGGAATHQGYRMLWGALGHHDQAALVAVARSTGLRVPERLAITVTEATQSLEIDGRLVPHVLVESSRGAADVEHTLDPAFASWILGHDHT